MLTETPSEIAFTQTGHFDTTATYQKLIFLDINGVLNNAHEPRMPHSHNCISESNYNNLLYILEQVPDAKIILSSSWRYGRTWEQCSELLAYYFGMYNVNIIGRTPVVNSRGGKLNPNYTFQELADSRKVYSRGYEVQYVVERLKPSHYVIIDNWDGFLVEQQDKHVRTCAEYGLTRENAQDVIAKLTY